MKISKLILLACVWGSIVSCEDLLDPKLTNEWSSETVWTNPDMAQAVLTQVYADLMVVPEFLRCCNRQCTNPKLWFECIPS